jgi:hypothetical protein
MRELKGLFYIQKKEKRELSVYHTYDDDESVFVFRFHLYHIFTKKNDLLGGK